MHQTTRPLVTVVGKSTLPLSCPYRALPCSFPALTLLFPCSFPALSLPLALACPVAQPLHSPHQPLAAHCYSKLIYFHCFRMTRPLYVCVRGLFCLYSLMVVGVGVRVVVGLTLCFCVAARPILFNTCRCLVCWLARLSWVSRGEAAWIVRGGGDTGL